LRENIAGRGVAQAEATEPFCVHPGQIERLRLSLGRREYLVIRDVAPGKQRACLAQWLQEFELREFGHAPWHYKLATHSIGVAVFALEQHHLEAGARQHSA
jgi:hypothetical protein